MAFIGFPDLAWLYHNVFMSMCLQFHAVAPGCICKLYYILLPFPPMNLFIYLFEISSLSKSRVGLDRVELGILAPIHNESWNSIGGGGPLKVNHLLFQTGLPH